MTKILEKWALFQWDHIRARELISCSFFMLKTIKYSKTFPIQFNQIEDIVSTSRESLEKFIRELRISSDYS